MFSVCVVFLVVLVELLVAMVVVCIVDCVGVSVLHLFCVCYLKC